MIHAADKNFTNCSGAMRSNEEQWEAIQKLIIVCANVSILGFFIRVDLAANLHCYLQWKFESFARILNAIHS